MADQFFQFPEDAADAYAREYGFEPEWFPADEQSDYVWFEDSQKRKCEVEFVPNRGWRRNPFDADFNRKRAEDRRFEDGR